VASNQTGRLSRPDLLLLSQYDLFGRAYGGAQQAESEPSFTQVLPDTEACRLNHMHDMAVAHRSFRQETNPGLALLAGFTPDHSEPIACHRTNRSLTHPTTVKTDEREVSPSVSTAAHGHVQTKAPSTESYLNKNLDQQLAKTRNGAEIRSHEGERIHTVSLLPAGHRGCLSVPRVPAAAFINTGFGARQSQPSNVVPRAGHNRK